MVISLNVNLVERTARFRVDDKYRSAFEETTQSYNLDLPDVRTKSGSKMAVSLFNASMKGHPAEVQFTLRHIRVVHPKTKAVTNNIMSATLVTVRMLSDSDLISVPADTSTVTHQSTSGGSEVTAGMSTTAQSAVTDSAVPRKRGLEGGENEDTPPKKTRIGKHKSRTIQKQSFDERACRI